MNITKNNGGMRKLKPMEIRGMHPNVIQLSSTAVGVILGPLEIYTGCIITSERFLPVCLHVVSKWNIPQFMAIIPKNRLFNAIQSCFLNHCDCEHDSFHRILRGTHVASQVVPMGYQRPAPRPALPVGRRNRKKMGV